MDRFGSAGSDSSVGSDRIGSDSSMIGSAGSDSSVGSVRIGSVLLVLIHLSDRIGSAGSNRDAPRRFRRRFRRRSVCQCIRLTNHQHNDVHHVSDDDECKAVF